MQYLLPPSITGVYAFDADNPGAGPLWAVSFMRSGSRSHTMPHEDVDSDDLVPEIWHHAERQSSMSRPARFMW